jgi:hypothetical protein
VVLPDDVRAKTQEAVIGGETMGPKS